MIMVTRGKEHMIMEDRGDIITLIDEGGQEEDFEVIITFELKGSEYAILAPADSDEESDAYAFKIVYDDAEKNRYSLVSIEDDEEYNDVAIAYEALIEEEM